MRTLDFTIRRKYSDPSDPKKSAYYGNHQEEVQTGKNKGEMIPCILVSFKRAPEGFDELLSDIGGDKNFSKFIDRIYRDAIVSKIRSDVFLKAGDSLEQTPEGREKVLNSIEMLTNNFTFANLLTETFNKSAAWDEINSAEMQALVERGTPEALVEYARRVRAILDNTRGVTL